MFSPIHQTRLLSAFKENSCFIFLLFLFFLLLNEGLARPNLLVINSFAKYWPKSAASPSCIHRVGHGLCVSSTANKAAYSVLCTCPRTINYLPATPTVNIYCPQSQSLPPPKHGMTHKLGKTQFWLVSS